MQPLKMQHRDPRTLFPHPNNPRQHSRKQIKQLTRSFAEFGFMGGVIINRDGFVLAGNGRVEAAIQAGLTSIPCFVADHLTEAQQRAYVIADNQIAMNSTFDQAKLQIELQSILQMDQNFDLTVTGLDIEVIDEVFSAVAPEDKSPSAKDEALPPVDDERPPVSRLGDEWICGKHLLLCGDALDRESYDRVLGQERAQLVIGDPPFNLPDSVIGGSGSVKHGNFIMAAGEMSGEQYEAFLLKAFRNMAAFSVNGSIHFMFMDWRHLSTALAAGAASYTELKNIIVWVKETGGMGSFYRSRHEFVLAFKNGTAPHINTFELGQRGRYRTNVWEYRGLNSGGADRLEQLRLHPTVKPVKMLADAMLDCSQRGGIVLDPFGGSGSTMIAAEKTGRHARLIELDPVYVDRAVRRWQKFAKEDAVHGETGETFAARERACLSKARGG